MSMRSYTVIAVSLIFSLMMCGRAMAQENQQSTIPQASMPSLSFPPGASVDSPIPVIDDKQLRADLVARLGLQEFENVSEANCQVDKPCSGIPNLNCVRSACGQAGSKEPSLCFPQFKGDKRLANQLICQTVESPSVENIRAVLIAVSDIPEAQLVGSFALIQAMKENSMACQKVVKDFVGPYGKSWNIPWLITMSGCRILSHERTSKEEEDDYLTWKEIGRKETTCADIINSELRDACYSGVEAP